MKKKTKTPKIKSTPDQKPLTPKEQMFVKEYLIDLNATKAAIRAGYSAKTARQIASRLLSKVNIQEEIARLATEIGEKVELDVEYVLNNLKEIVERCMQRAPVMVKAKGGKWVQAQDEEGNDVWRFDGKNAVAALSRIGQHLQMFPTNVKVSGDKENPLFEPINVTVRGCHHSNCQDNKPKPMDT